LQFGQIVKHQQRLVSSPILERQTILDTMLTGDLWVTTLRLNEFATTGRAKLVCFNSH